MLKDGDKVKLEPRRPPYDDNPEWSWIAVRVTDTGFDAYTRAWECEPICSHPVSHLVVRLDVGFDKIRG